MTGGRDRVGGVYSMADMVSGRYYQERDGPGA